jgi:hypothetical protein
MTLRIVELHTLIEVGTLIRWWLQYNTKVKLA